MSADYPAIAKRVLAAVARKGGPVIFGGDGGSVYDPILDQWSGGSSATFAGKAIQTEPTATDLARFAAQNLVLVQPITLFVAAEGLGTTPEPGMSMVWGAQRYTVKDALPYAADGVTMLYHTVTGSK